MTKYLLLNSFTNQIGSKEKNVMKTKLSLYISAFLFLALIAGLAMPMQAARAATICVNPGGTDGCFATIQAAIDAVTTTDGDTINVAAGTYPEAVVINKSLNLIGAGIGLSVIQAPASLPAATSLDSAVVSILGGSVNAEITGFTIAGPGPSACGSIKAGVFVRGSADANIHHNRIQDIRDNAAPVSGCQNGIGIVVGRNADATVGTATIANNEIVTYQKGGIVVDGTGSNANITGNTVTGIGTTAITAQNGIQISRGATATLLGNNVTGNSFHLEGSPWDWGAAGILLYQSGSVTMSGGNAISGNDQNLYIDSATGVSFGAEAFGPSPAPLDVGYNIINLTTLNLNLTNVTYPGSLGNYNIEDRIWHAIDDPTVGLVACSLQ
ncbi:MAG: right-handed parallel beta-helix repeat-containing protein [Anaerolineales bacterium]|nr:right-handed parallel beta-helix repeat-containing protein [Anaerolineales bacterium]